MRVMVLVHGNDKSEAEQFDDPQVQAEFAEMGKYNEELVKAGVMLAGEGLSPTSQGKRVTFGDGAPSVVDGPFAEAKELVAGFWIWQVSSMDEAVEWLKRAPFREGAVDIRRIYEENDFEGKVPQEVLDAESALRAKIAEQ
jgi:hypothetical protein